MTRITQLDSNLLLRIFLRAPLVLYLSSRLRRLTSRVETLHLRTLRSDKLDTLQRYINIKKLVCTWWTIEHDQILPPLLTSLSVRSLSCCCFSCENKLSIASLKHLTSLAIDNIHGIRTDSMPPSLTQLHLSSISDIAISFYRRDMGYLPNLVETDLIHSEEEYDPSIEAPVHTKFNGRNTSIRHAVVLDGIHVQYASLHLYRNLTKLFLYSDSPADTRDIATVSRLTELRCENLVGRWSDLSVLSKLVTATVNIHSNICLHESPPNLTNLTVCCNRLSRSVSRGDWCPPLLTLKIRGRDFHPTFMELLPTTLRQLEIESLVNYNIEYFSAPLTTLTVRVETSIRLRSLPSTLTALDIGTAEIPQTAQLPKSLRVIRAGSIRGIFYLPNFRSTYCSDDNTLTTRCDNGMVKFSLRTYDYTYPTTRLPIVTRAVIACLLTLLVLCPLCWLFYNLP